MSLTLSCGFLKLHAGSFFFSAILFPDWDGVGTPVLILSLKCQVPVGANPVQVEMGEFEDGAEETVEEVVADSKSLPCHLAHLDGPCPLGDTRTSPRKFLTKGMHCGALAAVEGQLGILRLGESGIDLFITSPSKL